MPFFIFRKQVEVLRRKVVAFVICLLLSNTLAFAQSNKSILDYTNISQWHQYGYTGKGVKIVVSDKGQIDFKQSFINSNNLVDYYKDTNSKHVENDHIQKVVQTLQQIVPDATIVLVSNKSFGNAIHVAVKENAQILTMSISYDGEHQLDWNSEIIEKAYSAGIFMNSSAGNKGRDGLNITSGSPYWHTTGAVHLVDGFPIRAKYSSYGDKLNFMGISKIDVWEKYNNNYIRSKFEGTSASTPFVSGMTALYYQYFNEKNGRFPTVDETREFIYDNCVDLEYEGYDKYTGHGVFILPELNLRDEIVTSEINPIAIKTKKSDDKDWYIHIDWLEEYLSRGYKLRRN